jgi:hypothetical protein
MRIMLVRLLLVMALLLLLLLQPRGRFWLRELMLVGEDVLRLQHVHEREQLFQPGTCWWKSNLQTRWESIRLAKREGKAYVR